MEYLCTNLLISFQFCSLLLGRIIIALGILDKELDGQTREDSDSLLPSLSLLNCTNQERAEWKSVGLPLTCLPTVLLSSQNALSEYCSIDLQKMIDCTPDQLQSIFDLSQVYFLFN